MDARIDLFASLGLRVGEAHVLRNAGAIVNDDVIRSLVISQRLLGTRAITVIGHTRCGLTAVDEKEVRATWEAETGHPFPHALGAFDDLEIQVRESVRRIRGCDHLPYREQVRGLILDVDSQQLSEVQDLTGVG